MCFVVAKQVVTAKVYVLDVTRASHTIMGSGFSEQLRDYGHRDHHYSRMAIATATAVTDVRHLGFHDQTVNTKD